MATPCLHAQSNRSFVRPLRKQAIRRHFHTHARTHAHSLKTISGLSVIQEHNDYAFSDYNCITLKHLYINDISVDYSYNSSMRALHFCIFNFPINAGILSKSKINRLRKSAAKWVCKSHPFPVTLKLRTCCHLECFVQSSAFFLGRFFFFFASLWRDFKFMVAHYFGGSCLL